MKFSVLIPTWNNLSYLQNCIYSIRSHSAEDHQIIVIVNEGNDGTVEWLDKEKITYVHHKENVGICTGLNSATDSITEEYLVYLNDDMYVLPNWDSAFSECIDTINHKSFMLSGTMIEPSSTGNDCVLIQDFGTTLESFQEKELLKYHSTAQKQDWTGASWPPMLMPVELWKKVGGMSEEFSPGMYSDPDLSMKLWKEGVRYFRGIGDARVYHFGSKSTRKLDKNIGRSIFLNKWSVTSRYFYSNILKMGSLWNGPLAEHKEPLGQKIIHHLKKIRT